MATPDKFQELVDGGRISMDDFATFILLQPQHITTRLVTKGFDPPKLFKDGCLLHRFTGFYASLREDHVAFLKAAGLYYDMREEQIYVNWPLLEACVERWNPQTHTFFFKHGEMTITVEATETLLSLQRKDGSGSLLTSHCEDAPPLFLLLSRISRDDTTLRWLTKGEDLNLLRLWEFIRPKFLSTSETDKRALRLGLLLIIGGVILFPQGKGMMRRGHVALILQHVYVQRFSLAQSVLAHLIAGLDSASEGKSFFGSPYLFSAWVERHFAFTVDIRRVQNPDGGMFEERRSRRETRQYFRLRLDHLHEGDIIFRPPGIPLPLVPVNEESESILIGGLCFVAYAAGRCVRQAGGDCRIPGSLSHIPRLEDRDFSPNDTRRLKDVLVHWKCHTCFAVSTLTSYEMSLHLRDYLSRVHLRAPDDLASLFQKEQERNNIVTPGIGLPKEWGKRRRM